MGLSLRRHTDTEKPKVPNRSLSEGDKQLLKFLYGPAFDNPFLDIKTQSSTKIDRVSNGIKLLKAGLVADWQDMNPSSQQIASLTVIFDAAGNPVEAKYICKKDRENRTINLLKMNLEEQKIVETHLQCFASRPLYGASETATAHR